MRIVKATVWSVTLYRAETWTQFHWQNIAAFEMGLEENIKDQLDAENHQTRKFMINNIHTYIQYKCVFIYTIVQQTLVIDTWTIKAIK